MGFRGQFVEVVQRLEECLVWFCFVLLSLSDEIKDTIASGLRSSVRPFFSEA